MGNHLTPKRLNPAFVAAVQPTHKTTRFGDGNGLHLVVTPSGGRGGKSWVQRLVVRGVPRELGLGSVREVSLRQARARALENRRIARRGGDPAPRRKTPTFAEAFDAVVALRRPTWKDPETMEARWRASMERHAMDRLGTLPVGAVASADVLAVLEPVWASLDEAPRIRQRIGLVMQWAIAQGHRRDNPTGEVLTAARTKTNRPHRVPLSDRAVEVLREAASTRRGELVFPSSRGGAAIHRRTFGRLMPALGIAAHPHGFRSSFRDWAAECTDAPREAMQAALGHAVPNATEAAYARSDLFGARRTLMRQWADFLAAGAAPA